MAKQSWKLEVGLEKEGGLEHPSQLGRIFNRPVGQPDLQIKLQTGEASLCAHPVVKLPVLPAAAILRGTGKLTQVRVPLAAARVWPRCDRNGQLTVRVFLPR